MFQIVEGVEHDRIGDEQRHGLKYT